MMLVPLFLSLVLGVMGAAVGPINPYPPQSLNVNAPGVNSQDCTCRLASWINMNNIDELKLQTKFRYWMAQSCSLDRGLFVINDKEYQGKTFSCADMPPQWVPGVKNPTLDDVYAANSGETLREFIDIWVQAVYNTSIIKSGSTCPFTAGYVEFSCGRHSPPYMTVAWAKMLDYKPIRGVNIGGYYVLEPWINGGFYPWNKNVRDQLGISRVARTNATLLNELYNHWDSWYNESDWMSIKSKGLNAVRLPLAWWYFAEAAGVSGPDPYVVPKQPITSPENPIVKTMQQISKAGLKVLVDLHAAPCSQNGFDNSGNISSETWQHWGEYWMYTKSCQDNHVAIVKYMAKWIVDILPPLGVKNTVLGLELVNEPWLFLDPSLIRDFYFRSIYEIRSLHSGSSMSGWTYETLPIIIHDSFRQFIWHDLLKHYPLTNVYMDTHLYHSFNIADVASDTHKCAMQKQEIHQYLACIYGEFVRFESCNALPTLVGEWSLAIDNCMGRLNGIPSGYNLRSDQRPFGQCKHGDIADRHKTVWWIEHIRDFANKQMIAFEHDLGWFFWTWKLDAFAEEDPSAYFWSFSKAWDIYFVPPFNATACQQPPYIKLAPPNCTEQAHPSPMADLAPMTYVPAYAPSAKNFVVDDERSHNFFD